ncbi:PREDICTED: uncharacterized protein C1orf106 homolog [Bison bison bison]|uniref:Uncharacterized protein C1orf106 homolog n=1 Tax=Bison bison bison TaxID=43346 RepID=A0A6P3GCR0_BISBB|nr:PREDICTED: uncharacterized protein C1orf106 homolog [Bison bison bison]
MDSKDEVSDTDSGIILQSGPDSPVSPAKELTHAVRKQQRALEERLEACLEELRRLCLREALSLGGPCGRRRPGGGPAPGSRRDSPGRGVGGGGRGRWGQADMGPKACWTVLRPGPGLGPLQGPRLSWKSSSTRAPAIPKALQNLDPPVPEAALSSVTDLPNSASQTALELSQDPAGPIPTHTARLWVSELSASDDSSLSDGLPREEEAPQVPKPPLEAPDPPARPLPPQSLEGLQPAGPEMGGLERAPIQNSPWKETSLDHPYEKPRKSSEAGSESSSPASTPQDGPSTSSLWLLEPASYCVVPIRSVPGQRQGRTSAPATPDMQGRRGHSQPLSSLGCSWPPRPGSTLAPVPAAPSTEAPSPSRELGPVLGSGPAQPDVPDGRVPTVCVLRRSPEGAPVQVFVPENGEIMSQV